VIAKPENSSRSLGFVKFVDKAAVIQFLDEAHIDEILRVKSFRLALIRQRLEDGTNPLEGRILLGRELMFLNRPVVGLGENLLVLQPEISSQYGEPELPIGFKIGERLRLGRGRSVARDRGFRG
jgi:hypothetical protein